MEEKIEYNQDARSDNGSTWQTEKTNMLALDPQATTCSSPQDHLLKYFPKKEIRSKRPIIPATLLEKLAYFRCCVSLPSKTQNVSMQHAQFNRYLWGYIFNVFFKSLPHTFVYIFLASYAPDEHFFLSKMVPICYGFSMAYVLAALLEFASSSDTFIKLLDYAVCGILYKNPWNRCHGDSHRPDNITVYCYSLIEFKKKLKNGTFYFNISSYVTSDGERFQAAPMVYYWDRRIEVFVTGNMNIVYFLIIWIVVCLHHKQLFKRYIWKTLNNLQMLINGIYLIVFVHLVVDYFLTQLDKEADVPAIPNESQNLLWTADVDMLAESMVAPPVVHILAARSTQEIQPTRDSAVIILSNAIYCVFKGLLFYRLKKYCEIFVNAPILIYSFNPDSFFYFWPIYFSTFYFGDVCSVIFITSHFLMELFTIIVTFQCLVEAIVCEWRLAKRIIVTILIFLILSVWYYMTSKNPLKFFFILTKANVTMMEVIGIYLIYPLGRLIDDITFFNGIKPTQMRILNLKLVPIYYGVKVWKLLDALYELAYKSSPKAKALMIYYYSTYWSDGVISVLILSGALYSAYVYMWKKKRGWKSLFSPDDTWGPPFAVRELRKQYDSRDYVGCQAPRKLSRYMIQKAESKVYNLDLRYDVYPVRRSTTTSSGQVTDTEKKSI